MHILLPELLPHAELGDQGGCIYIWAGKNV